jgi:peptidoglycan/xylan/chitin deacetylase (PgdA/CDA1 family)/GT2 family glycosyltransferase
MIVVTDAPGDPAHKAGKDLQVPIAFQIHSSGSSGRAAAWNQGAAFASGDYCLFLDDGVVPDPGLVAAHLEVQQRSGGVVSIGWTRSASHLCADASSLGWPESPAGLDEQTDACGCPLTFWRYSGTNLCVPRMNFLHLGGFDTGLPACGDVELAFRLEQNGLHIVFVPQARARRHHGHSVHEVFAHFEKMGQASVTLFQHHPRLIERLPLGRFGDTGVRGLLLRRLLLAIHCPTALLALATLLFGRLVTSRTGCRFMQAYCYWRGVQRAADRGTWRQLVRAPVILMYHAIGQPGEHASEYVVPVKQFARQMAWLMRLGYHVLGLEDLVRFRHDGHLPPERSVVITFDDGYRDNVTVAMPVLRRYGFTATVFAVSGALGRTNEWDPAGELAGRALVSADDLRELSRCGFQIGAHSRTHARLTELPPKAMEDEVVRSRTDLEQAIGRPVVTFAYPHGLHDPETEAAVMRAGYEGVCTSEPGANDPAVPATALRRIEVRGTDPLFAFVLALWMGKSRVGWRLWHAQ